jgi:hypothetical protein
MQLVGNLRSPHRDRAITGGEDNDLVVQLLNLHHYRAISHQCSVTLGWPLAWSPQHAANHDHSLVQRRGYRNHVRELRKGDAIADALRWKGQTQVDTRLRKGDIGMDALAFDGRGATMPGKVATTETVQTTR